MLRETVIGLLMQVDYELQNSAMAPFALTQLCHLIGIFSFIDNTSMDGSQNKNET